MAKEIVKKLLGINYHLNEKMVDISWSADTYYDGELLASEKHCGAYPVMPDGELFDPGKTAEGVCLVDILGHAATDAIANFDSMKAQIESLTRLNEHFSEQVEIKRSENESLKIENENLKIESENLKAEIETIKATASEQ
jgi:hypothetical protein